jgi:hypothetical protein
MKFRKLVYFLLAVIMVTSMLSFSLPAQAAVSFSGYDITGPPLGNQDTAPAYRWTAYNDSAWYSGQPETNITKISIPVSSGSTGPTSGVLKNLDDGSNTPVTAAFTASGTVQVTSNGSDAASGTDAATTFTGKVSSTGVVNGTTSGWWIDLTLSGLDPARTYTFAGTTVRGSSSYSTRNSTYILSGDEAATNASSSGVTVIDNHTIAFNTGDNSARGYVVRWQNINPGSDGTIVIRSRASTTGEISGSSSNAYGLSVFMLAEEFNASDPAITISGIPLNDFNSQPGTPSAEQTYTVSGSRLTGNLVITAPGNFQISTTSGSGFASTLTLTPSLGTVNPTPIYVRFYRSTQGVSSGNITHASTGAITRNVEVIGRSGNAPVTVSFRNGVSGYAGTMDTFIMESQPESANGNESWVEWDADDPYGEGKSNFGLLRFDSIFGSGAGQIPAGAAIESASLTYVVSNSGDSCQVNEVAVDWNESVTYNGFGSTAGVQTGDYGSSVGTADGSSTGAYTLDVTSSLVAWNSNPSANFGWIFRPTDADGVEFCSSEYGTVSDRPLLTVTYFPGGHINQSPNQPSLVRPLNAATGVSSSPTLQVTVTDPDSDPMDVNFYGRRAGSSVPGADFTIAVIPDTQNETTNYPETFNAQTQWIADNHSARNIVFATHVGDIVNTATSTSEWTRADTAMDKLDAANVAYSVGTGNHDVGSGSLYSTYFGSSRFTGKSWYGGYYTAGNDNSTAAIHYSAPQDWISS